ncbi:MAG: hypothetical protein M3N29_11125 [Chloroflexota bacterium]|nr:hypothetical protein [Chloroflexota bacterium]
MTIRSVRPSLPLFGVALLSAATLLAQASLTRVLAVGQGYHFAFLVISLALLGFGASGTLLAVAPRLREPALWPWYGTAFAALTAGSFFFIDAFPFDAYLVARDGSELVLLFADLVALALPFLFAGLLIGSMLTRHGERAGRIYGANLFGSGLGAVLAPTVIDVLGSERSVLGAGVLGGVAALTLAGAIEAVGRGARSLAAPAVALLATLVLAAMLPLGIELTPSPYRALSQIRLNPDARVVATRQDSRSRLDIVVSPTIRSAPGLSLSYTGPLPPQAGLLIDGDGLLPVPATSLAPPALAASLPIAVAHRLRPGATVLMLGSGGGTDAWAALELGAREVTVVEPNALVFEALTVDLRSWAGLADDPRVKLVNEPIRSFIERDSGQYDVVLLTLSEAYRPVSSGAISLNEDFRLTVEAFRGYLERLSPDGLFVVTRWAQTRPTESLRTLALLLEALNAAEPRARLLAFRGFQTVTLMASARPLSERDADVFFATIRDLRYDLVLAPRIRRELLNRWAQLPTLDEHERARQLTGEADRSGFYAGYEFNIAPPRDDHPFFFHFFRLEQTPALLAELGRRWQPFGGGGYFILVALLGFAVAAAAVAIVVPLVARPQFRRALADQPAVALRALAYVVAIGLAFLFVEVTLVQRAILVLGHATPAFATIVGTLLVASGIGSALSFRIPWRAAMLILVAVLAAHAGFEWLIGPRLLALPDPLPPLVIVGLVAPVGFLMGVPFPRAVRAIAATPSLVAWAWAANGSASVVSGIIATMIALSFGFSAVLAIAAALYLVAALLVPLVVYR